jgi:PAS domain S-box-containing protein
METPMTTKQPETVQQLRQRAEEKFRADETSSTEPLSPEETKKLLHELQVHQIELEMQVEELRDKQNELDAARARYFDLYDLAPMGYLTFNARGLIYEANLSAATMLGVTRKVLFNALMAQFLLHEDQDLYYLHRKRLLETGEVQGWDMRLMRADGSTFWAHMQATPQHNGEYWIVFNDISERLKLEAEKLLLEQQFQQAQKLESLGVLAGGIAHDFNNLLTVIMSSSSLAQLRPNMVGELLPEIDKAVERAADLCRQMLAYAGKTMMTMKQVRMAELVEDMIRMLKATISQNVTITSDLALELPPVKGDAGQLRQIVMNLIVNAAEAIGEGHGEIRVVLSVATVAGGKAEKDHLGKIIAAGQYVCLEVTDSGCGMDDETRQRVFEPFYTTKFTGRGLGMSAVLGIIAAHKGALQLISSPGEGTTFKVYLPVQGSDIKGGTPLPYVPLTPWKGNGTLLLVEDEPQISMVAKELIQALGFSVIEAANGREALERYQENAGSITLVVTDIGMPVMDGYDLFNKLKVLAPDLPIIISSGFGETIVSSRIATGAAAGYLNKPYSLDQLCEVLKVVVEKRR